MVAAAVRRDLFRAERLVAHPLEDAHLTPGSRFLHRLLVVLAALPGLVNQLLIDQTLPPRLRSLSFSLLASNWERR